MPDMYSSFSRLALNENHEHFCMRVRSRHGTIAIIAPHGGKIEPGTSEIADAIAGNDLSFYAFEGKKPRGNRKLHITSTRFDEPGCMALIDEAITVISIHGENSEEKIVFIGGLDEQLQDQLRESLHRRGFRVEKHADPCLQGRDRENICNRGKTGKGVQLELSKGLRRSFFESLTEHGRQIKNKRFTDFVVGVREAITS